MSSSSSQQQRRRQLMQGPRPAPLRVHRDSHRQKPPPPQLRQPLIIYTLSPKVVHAHPADFMSVVQRLTGATAGSTSCSIPPRRPSSSALTRLPFPFQLQPAAAGAPPRDHHLDVVSPAPALAQGRHPTGIMSAAPSFFSAPGGGGGGINLFSPAFPGHNAALPPGCTAVAVDAAPSAPDNPTYLHYLSAAASAPFLHYNWDHVFNNHPDL